MLLIFLPLILGVLTGEAMGSMANMLAELYSPLINAQANLSRDSEAGSEQGQPSGGLIGPNGENIQSEFNGTMSKFEAQIHDALKQLTGDVQLQV